MSNLNLIGEPQQVVQIPPSNSTTGQLSGARVTLGSPQTPPGSPLTINLNHPVDDTYLEGVAVLPDTQSPPGSPLTINLNHPVDDVSLEGVAILPDTQSPPGSPLLWFTLNEQEKDTRPREKKRKRDGEPKEATNNVLASNHLSPSSNLPMNAPRLALSPTGSSSTSTSCSGVPVTPASCSTGGTTPNTTFGLSTTDPCKLRLQRVEETLRKIRKENFDAGLLRSRLCHEINKDLYKFPFAKYRSEYCLDGFLGMFGDLTASKASYWRVLSSVESARIFFIVEKHDRNGPKSVQYFSTRITLPVAIAHVMESGSFGHLKSDTRLMILQAFWIFYKEQNAEPAVKFLCDMHTHIREELWKKNVDQVWFEIHRLLVKRAGPQFGEYATHKDTERSLLEKLHPRDSNGENAKLNLNVALWRYLAPLASEITFLSLIGRPEEDYEAAKDLEEKAKAVLSTITDAKSSLFKSAVYKQWRNVLFILASLIEQ